ncbi:MAG TPA: DUF362 domain-containing protein, partial [bacterium]|nr:DUF362 domain-containing protein [bacterium]
MTKSKVAILKTTPDEVLTDYEKLMKLAGFEKHLDKTKTTIIKNNISWHLMFPGANTTPWQMEGSIIALQKAGYNDIVCVQNKTVVSDAYKGEKLNKYTNLYKKYGIHVKFNFIGEDMKWIVISGCGENQTSA